MTPVRGDYGLYAVWIRQGWGTFGFLDVPLAGWLFPVLTALTATVAAAAGWVLARLRGASRLLLLAYFGIALGGLLIGLHVTEYRSIIAQEGTILQARYLLPGLSLFGLAVALVIAHLPPRARAVVCASCLAGLLILQLIALGTVTRTYYTETHCVARLRDRRIGWHRRAAGRGRRR